MIISIQQLKAMQNIDANRGQAYIDARDKFLAHISEQRKTSPLKQLYLEFRPKLYSIIMPRQNFSMETSVIKQIFQKLFFTKTTDLYQIKFVEFSECFPSNVQERIEGLKQFLQELEEELKQNNSIRYTTTNIIFKSSNLSSDIFISFFQQIIFNQCFKVKSIIIENEFLDMDFGSFLDNALKYINNLGLNDYSSLIQFSLVNIYTFQLDIFKLVDLLVFRDKIQLKELTLRNIQVVDNQEVKKTLQQKIKDLQQSFHLIKVSIGNFRETIEELESGLIEILVIQRQSILSHLELYNIRITNEANRLNQVLQSHQNNGYRPLSQLKTLVLSEYSDYNQSEWENICDLFLQGVDLNTNKLILDNIVINESFIKGYLTSQQRLFQLINRQNMMDKSFQLKTLILKNCTFQTDIFSIFFSSFQNRIEILKIEQCYNLDIAISMMRVTHGKFGDLIKYLTIAMKEVVLDGTQIQDIDNFAYFFKYIVMNKERQQLQKLSLQDCQLNNEQMQIINQLLADLKKHQQEQKIKNYLQLRQFNFNNNPSISYLNWKGFFDNLFSVFNVEEQDELQKDQQNQLLQAEELENRIEQEIESKTQILEKKSDQIVQIIKKKRLNLPKKILYYPLSFPIFTPTQLEHLELDLNFLQESFESKQILYNRILQGLVYFAGSHLKELVLFNVDMQLFTNSTDFAIQRMKLYYENVKKLAFQDIIFPLKQLKIDNAQQATQENLEKLAIQYVGNDFICLEDLTLINVSEGNFFHNLLTQINKGKNPYLKKIELTSVISIMNNGECIDFFKNVMFNPNIPLQSLVIGKLVIMNTDESFEAEIKDHLVLNKSYKYPINNIALDFDNEQTYRTFQKVIHVYFKGEIRKLDRLSIRSSGDFSINLFEGWDDQQKAQTLCIKELILDYEIYMTLNAFKFFQLIRPQVQKLILTKLSSEKYGDIESLLENNLTNIQQFNDCSLSVTFLNVSPASTFIIQNFVFSRLLNFTEVKIAPTFIFQYFYQQEIILAPPEQNTLISNLRSLKLNFDLDYSSQDQLSKENLKLLGDTLIYNTNSLVQEFFLHYCHLKPDGVKALTSGAEQFRIRAKGVKNQLSLPLKFFSIYYSLLIDEEGSQIINRDIVFFEYITIEKIELSLLNWNDQMCISFCECGRAWLRKREQNFFAIKAINLGRNEQIISKKAWDLICDTFIFSDHTPYLETLYIHFMSFKDLTINYLCSKAKSFFFFKSSTYIHPIKRINFSQNTAITFKGWGRICRNFFFNQYFHLEELNLTDTMLDSDEKINAIKDAMTKRALLSPNQKLPLHSLFTKNLDLKNGILKYLSKKPDNYIHEIGFIEEIDQNQSIGLIEGVPESFGSITSLTQGAIYNSKDFINKTQWTQENSIRFSEFHIELVDGFLKGVNELFIANPLFKGHLAINYKTCDELATLFKYVQTEGEPYPFKLFFTPSAYQFYHSTQCKIRTINFIPQELFNSENVTQFHILDIWQLVNSPKNCIDIFYFDYYLDDDLIDEMILRGYTERDVINLVRQFPPSKIRLQDTLTLQALKGIYSILWDNYQFQYSNVLFDKDIFLNVGIAYSLREYVYDTYPKFFIARFFKMIFYHTFNIFVKAVPEYSFSQQIKDLNNYLQTKKIFYLILVILTIGYYSVCIIGPYAWTRYYLNYDYDKSHVCKKGVNPIAAYTYYCFACKNSILYIQSSYLSYSGSLSLCLSELDNPESYLGVSQCGGF